jgi:hypothetical protein
LLLAVLLCASLAQIVSARTTTINTSGAVAIDISSTFFDIDYSFSGGFANFAFDGPNIDHLASISSPGLVTGSYDVDMFSFEHDNNFSSIGSLTSLSQIAANDTITVLVFNGSGFSRLTINTSDLTNMGKTDFSALINAQSIWLTVTDDRISERLALKFVSIGFDGDNVHLVVKNRSDDVVISGPAKIDFGLSYKAWYWQSDSRTRNPLMDYGKVTIKPGQTAQFDFPIPKHIGMSTIEYFVWERNVKYFESSDPNGWQYPEPHQDCFDFVLTIQGRDNAYVVHGYSLPDWDFGK